MRLYIISTTCPKEKEARKISDVLLKKKIAACVKLQNVKSAYWWRGKIARENETLVSVITTKKNIQKVVAEIKKNHSYAVPEIIEIPITVRNKDYWEWACDVAK